MAQISTANTVFCKSDYNIYPILIYWRERIMYLIYTAL